jgi:Protein of unknown function (DUF3606)
VGPQDRHGDSPRIRAAGAANVPAHEGDQAHRHHLVDPHYEAKIVYADITDRRNGAASVFQGAGLKSGTMPDEIALNSHLGENTWQTISNKGPQDRSRISLLEPHEVQYWADKFNVSKERLSEAVRNVGHSAAAVEKELKRLA